MGGVVSRLVNNFNIFSKNKNKNPILLFRSINNQKWEEACFILQYRKSKNKNIDYKELIYVYNNNKNNEKWEYYVITNQNTLWVLQTEYIVLDSIMIFINGFYNPLTNQINWI
jgi:hypothetical protein